MVKRPGIASRAAGACWLTSKVPMTLGCPSTYLFCSVLFCYIVAHGVPATVQELVRLSSPHITSHHPYTHPPTQTHPSVPTGGAPRPALLDLPLQPHPAPPAPPAPPMALLPMKVLEDATSAVALSHVSSTTTWQRWDTNTAPGRARARNQARAATRLSRRGHAVGGLVVASERACCWRLSRCGRPAGPQLEADR